jgi:ribonuclease HI
MAVYVIFEPTSIRGIYDTWPECEVKVKGCAGAKFQKVVTRDHAESMLAGERKTLPPGLYAVLDGNHLGGIGVVLVNQVDATVQTRQELCTTLAAVFPDGIPAEDGSTFSTAEALASIRNVAAELGAAAFALRHIPYGQAVTLVHDYEGVGAWLCGHWRAKDPIVKALVNAIRRAISLSSLTVTFRHQRGHQVDRMGLDPLVLANQQADALATRASQTTAA